MKEKAQKFIESERHLPVFMRDFHDQKDLFKSISEWAGDHKSNKIGWIDSHCYSIDIFLYFMALHGYTLQKSKSKSEFHDIYESLKYYNEKRSEESSSFLKSVIEENKQ